jgi:hypothetical protein
MLRLGNEMPPRAGSISTAAVEVEGPIRGLRSGSPRQLYSVFQDFACVAGTSAAMVTFQLGCKTLAEGKRATGLKGECPVTGTKNKLVSGRLTFSA